MIKANDIEMVKLGGMTPEERERYEKNKIEINKKVSSLIAKSTRNAKLECCILLLCNKLCSSFCNSHSKTKYHYVLCEGIFMGDTKALLVGVCEYTFNPSVCPLPFCSNDVAAVYQALIDGLNVSAGNILVSGNNGRITKDCLLSDLQSILNATTDKDTLIIYFSGHGGNNCLAMSDGLLDLQSLVDLIGLTPPQNKIIILDSCHSGSFTVDEVKPLGADETVGVLASRGYAVLASCSENQTSGFNRERGLSIYTTFLVDALTSHFLIRKGKKSLESINEAIFHFAKLWNSRCPLQSQQPIFRTSMGGTVYFDVEEYTPYQVAKVYEETEKYIVYTVEPVHHGFVKRLSAKVILRYRYSLIEIAEIANEINRELRYVEVYQSPIAESRLSGKPTNIIWCHFGYSEEDMVSGTFACRTTWVDEDQDKSWWYKNKETAKVINGIYFEINDSYDAMKEFQQNIVMDDETIIREIRKISANIVNAAERFIRAYREYRNGELSEEDLINAVEPTVNEIHTLFIREGSLSYPSLQLREWAAAHEQLASVVDDFSLYYNKRHLDKWSTEDRIYLMGESIKKYESALETLRVLDETI